jgi:hypothetical protein
VRRKYGETPSRECPYATCEFKGVMHTHKGKDNVKLQIKPQRVSFAENPVMEALDHGFTLTEESCW